MTKIKPLEQLPTTRLGDRVIRRQRKPRGRFRIILQSVLKLFKGKNKNTGTK